MTGVKHGVDNRVNMNLPHTSKPEGCGTRAELTEKSKTAPLRSKGAAPAFVLTLHFTPQ